MFGKLKLILYSTIAIVIILLAACSPPPPQSRVYTVNCDPFMEVKHVSLPAEAAVGATITIVLCSNQTTGFQWSELAVIDAPTILEQIEHKYTPPEAGANVGVAGKETWIFRAVKKGKTTAFMEYSQPWEGGIKKEWTFTLQATVR